MSATIVYGVFKDNKGHPIEGVVLSFVIARPYRVEGAIVTSTEIKAETNSYGIFEVELPPTDCEADVENYYHVRIIHQVIDELKLVVPTSEDPIEFTQLKKFVPKFMLGYLG